MGRGGVEEIYDNHLRGYPGKERFEVDVKGRFNVFRSGSFHRLSSKKISYQAPHCGKNALFATGY
ncbi:MAG: hypothetical protein EBS28_02580 [Chlamydiae bacterium]|nr:hypothetical protein [Chlamydiota bacterium]